HHGNGRGVRRAAQGPPRSRNAEDHLRSLQIRDGADRDHCARDHSPAQGEVSNVARSTMMTARKTKPTAQLSAGAKACNLPRSAGSISACPVVRSSCYHPDTRATDGPAGAARVPRGSMRFAYDVLLTPRTDVVATRGSAGAPRTMEGQT